LKLAFLVSFILTSSPGVINFTFLTFRFFFQYKLRPVKGRYRTYNPHVGLLG